MTRYVVFVALLLSVLAIQRRGLKSAFLDVWLPFFLLVGPSSNGKSSLLKIAVSSWGGPSPGVLGGLSSLSATTNAAELNGLGARDMIVAYDDLQMLSAERGKRAVTVQQMQGGAARVACGWFGSEDREGL